MPKKAASRAVGRPTKLTPEVEQIIVGALSEGNYVGVACTLADVSEVTFYNWVNAADNESPGDLHYEFLKAVKKASAVAEASSVRQIRSGDKMWAAHMTFLERRFRERWGRPSASEVGIEK